MSFSLLVMPWLLFTSLILSYPRIFRHQSFIGWLQHFNNTAGQPQLCFNEYSISNLGVHTVFDIFARTDCLLQVSLSIHVCYYNHSLLFSFVSTGTKKDP